MITRTFDELARDLRTRRTVADRPPVLLLGAGASVDAGIGAMPELYAFFGLKNFQEFSAYIATTSAPERYRYLSQFLQTRAPAEVSPGYHALASLLAENYFDLVLTTNMDPLLDDALAAARLWRRDYLLLVNGVVRSDRLSPLLSGQSPRVKIVKLHGDLFQRFMAWTEAEMETFVDEIAPDLKAAVSGRDFLVVGYSLRDQRVRALVEGAGESIWFTHPTGIPPHLELPNSPASSRYRAVVASQCAFEQFFPALSSALKVDVVERAAATASAAVSRAATPQDSNSLLHRDAAVHLTATPSSTITAPRSRKDRAARGAEQPTQSVAVRAQTLDDVMAATFAVVGATGLPGSTAFLLAEPRVIVCDAFAAVPAIANGALVLLGGAGQRFEARVLRTATTHPFGPTLLEPPDTLLIPGIALSKESMKPGEVVQVLVAAGERTGVGTGTVTVAQVRPLAIEPVPKKVRALTQLQCLVVGGSSGAPVIDSQLMVRGFIVAASGKVDNPVCFAYGSASWAKELA